MATVTFFHAHPDDEAIATGGTMADLADQGHRVVLVTATRGELGETPDGLLAAGRCISATHVGAAAGKSMGNCMATGHAAGLAAALCAQQGIVPRELKVDRLQDKLRADRVRLELDNREQPNLRM